MGRSSNLRCRARLAQYGQGRGRGSGSGGCSEGIHSLCSYLPSDEAHGFGAGGRVMELPAHRAGDGLGAGLADAAHGHAQVFAFDDDDRAARFEVGDEGFDDLGGQAFLDLGAAGEHVHQPRQFAQPGDLPVVRGNVAHMRHPVERHQVVLAGGVERNVLDQDQFLVVQVEGGGQDFRRVVVQPGEHFGVGLGHPLRGVQEAAAVRVLADGQEDLADSRLDPGLVHNGGRGRTLPPPKRSVAGASSSSLKKEVTEEA